MKRRRVRPRDKIFGGPRPLNERRAVLPGGRLANAPPCPLRARLSASSASADRSPRPGSPGEFRRTTPPPNLDRRTRAGGTRPSTPPRREASGRDLRRPPRVRPKTGEATTDAPNEAKRSVGFSFSLLIKIRNDGAFRRSIRKGFRIIPNAAANGMGALVNERTIAIERDDVRHCVGNGESCGDGGTESGFCSGSVAVRGAGAGEAVIRHQPVTDTD